MKQSRFSTNISLYLRNDTRWSHKYYEVSNRNLYATYRMVSYTVTLNDPLPRSRACHYLTLNISETAQDGDSYNGIL